MSATTTVTPANRAPTVVLSVPAQTMTAMETAVLELAILFTDPDGDTLTYVAASSEPSVATVSVSGSALTVSAIAAGTTTVTATATDPGGLSASVGAATTVTPANRYPVHVHFVGDVPEDFRIGAEAAAEHWGGSSRRPRPRRSCSTRIGSRTASTVPGARLGSKLVTR